MDELAQQRRIRELTTEIEELKKDQQDLILALGFAAFVLQSLPKFKNKSRREVVDWLADNARKAS